MPAPAPANMADIDGAKVVMTARTITKKRVVCDSCCMGSDSSEDSRRTAGTYFGSFSCVRDCALFKRIQYRAIHLDRWLKLNFVSLCGYDEQKIMMQCG